MKKKYIGCSALLLLASLSSSVNATLVTGSVLDFSSASAFFSFDANDDGIFSLDERIYINSSNGLIVGSTQLASGSHSGSPNGTESPNIDEAWAFFGNTGLHQSTTPTTILSASGASATIDMSGWAITWNGTIDIALGSGTSGGIGNITCAVDCAAGDTYSLYYEATVPVGDPSGFGGAKYRLGLDGTSSSLSSGGLSSSSVDTDPGAIFGGTIGASTSTVPVPGAVWLFGSGLLGLISAARRKNG